MSSTLGALDYKPKASTISHSPIPPSTFGSHTPTQAPPKFQIKERKRREQPKEGEREEENARKKKSLSQGWIRFREREKAKGDFTNFFFIPFHCREFSVRKTKRKV